MICGLFSLPLALAYMAYEEPDLDLTYLPSQHDLHIFIPDDENPSVLEKSIDVFKSAMKLRTRVDKDAWLLDISPWGTEVNVAKSLNDMHLDVDDDLFWFRKNRQQIDLWEVYKKAPTHNVTYLEYGTWHSESGLETSMVEKYNRRRDLTVNVA